MIKFSSKLKTLSPKPGVYLYKDRSGEVIYVGKAKNLKKRVGSYFQKKNHDPKTEALVAEIKDLEYIIVSSELEALMLESNLIKKHLPRYNVLLRDDKNWQFIKIDYETEIPQIYTVRKIPPKSRDKFFGPYTSGLAVKNTLKLLKRVFRLCASKKVGRRACFAYHLGRCPGVCIGEVSPEAYRRGLKLIEQFLQNRQSEIVRRLRKEMNEAAARRRFEKAAARRDTIRSLQRIWEKQKIISPRKLSEDYLGLYQNSRSAIVKLFQVREGRLIGQETFELRTTGQEDREEILRSFIAQYYTEAQDQPKKTISRLNAPSRGKKLGLLRLAEENAKEYFEKNFQTPERLLLETKNQLGLPALPRRIEGFDISNIQGTNPVGSMVVFEEALPKKSDYRKFAIRGSSPDKIPKPDDVGMMKEMLERRFGHLNYMSLRGASSDEAIPLSHGIATAPRQARGLAMTLQKTAARKDTKAWPLPDLIVIDGGRGQLNTAVKVLQATPYQLTPVLGLAKRLEEIYLPRQRSPLRLPPDSPVLQLLQRLRDEAHRFALTFHSKTRSRAQTHSRLDEVPGIGPKTKKLLLQQFGSLNAVRKAALPELVSAVGSARAKQLKKYL